MNECPSACVLFFFLFSISLFWLFGSLSLSVSLSLWLFGSLARTHKQLTLSGRQLRRALIVATQTRSFRSFILPNWLFEPPKRTNERMNDAAELES